MEERGLEIGGENSLLARLGLQAAASSEVPNEPPPDEAEAYSKLVDEMRKLSGIAPLNQIDWAAVEQAAIKLAGRLRNLNIYHALCLSVLFQRGYGALALALSSYGDLIEHNWDGIRPLRTREQMIQVFAGYLLGAIEVNPPKAKDAKELTACAQGLERIQAKLGPALDTPAAQDFFKEVKKKLGDYQRALAPPVQVEVKSATPSAKEPLVSRLPEKPQGPVPAGTLDGQSLNNAQAPAADPVPNPSPSEGTETAQQSGPVEAPVAQAASDSGSTLTSEDDKKRLKTLEQQVRSTLLDWTGLLRQTDPTNPRSYRLLRAYLWSTVQVPMANAPPGERTGEAAKRERRTLLPAPPRTAAIAVKNRLQSQAFRKAIDDIETLVQRFPYWLDLQHLIVICLEQIQASVARDAVVAMVRSLLTEHPRLPHYIFSGDEPFVDAFGGSHFWELTIKSVSTAAWLRTVAASTGELIHRPLTVPALSKVEIGPLGLQPTAGGPGQNLESLHQQLLSTTTARGRFEIRARMAEWCIEQHRIDIAVPLLQTLRREAEEYRLATWEPERYLGILRLQVVLGSLSAGEQATAAEAWAALCQLSPYDAQGLGAPMSPTTG